MEETQTTVQDQKAKNLYTRHVDGFIRLAQQDLDRALECYGFTVWHSLPPKERATFKEQLGAQPLEAIDYYNRGTAFALEGDDEEAIADFKAALKKDPEHPLALFNLAVCLERQRRYDEARDAYKKYLKILDRAQDRRNLPLGTEAQVEEERARVRGHLETLGKS